MNPVGWGLLGVGLFATPLELWPGLLGGALLFWLLSHTRFRFGLLWFSSLPGLYHFWGISPRFDSINQAFLRWGITLGILVLLALAVSSFRENRRGWALWGVPLLLLRPDGWTLGLAVVVYGLGVLVHEQTRARELGRRFFAESPALGMLSATLLGLLLAVGPALPPKPRLLVSPPEVQTLKADPQTSSQKPVQPAASPPKVVKVRQLSQTPFARFAFLGIDFLFNLILVLIFAITLLLVVLTLRVPQGKARLGGNRLLILVLVVFTWSMIGFWFLINQRSLSGGSDLAAIAGQTSGTATVAPSGVQTINSQQNWFYALGLVMAVLTTGALLFLLIWLWRAYRDPNQANPTPPEPLVPLEGGWRTGPPDHRIRRAYYGFLQQMELLGFSRMAFESAREYAQRLGELKPPVQGQLLELVALYEPVRYGENPSEAQAARAEFLASKIPPHYKEQPQ